MKSGEVGIRKPKPDNGVHADYGDFGLCLPILNAPAHRPYVVAQVGQTLDGRIATATGQSRYINRQAALDHLHRLRASVDAVVVGIGTVLADDPQLNVRRVPGRNPARVIIDPSGRLPSAARCLADDASRYVVCGTKRACPPSGTEAIVIAAQNGALCPSAIVAALFERGMKRILIEGGADTISRFIDAGMVDRLHVLVAPMILGSGKPCFSLAPIAHLDEAMRPETEVRVLDDGDVLFDCNLRSLSQRS